MNKALMTALLLALVPGCIWFHGDDDDDDGPTGAEPCDEPARWPESIASGTYPFIVHFEETADLPMAVDVVALLESAWAVEFGVLGFDEPPSDGGACGPDGKFDVFLWRGVQECYVDVFAENDETVTNDWIAYMVVDPWGPYGGEILDATLAHELNHAAQAAYDWDEPLAIFEMTSTFMEDVVFDDDNGYRAVLSDFQQYPDWSIDSSESPGDNWFIYSASLYLFYLRDRFFAGDPSFVEQIWALSRNPAGVNEPDFEDGIDQLLAPHASSYFDSVVEFSKWRWFTATRDDGAHFEEGAFFPPNALVPFTTATAGSAVSVTPQPMLLGTSYLEISRASGTAPIDVTIADVPGIAWAVQAIPGMSGGDGDLVDLASGTVAIALTTAGTRVLVVTALPAGPYDVDDRTDDRFPLSITLGP